MQWDMPSMWGAECRYQMAVLLWMWQNINLVLIISGSRKHLITEGRVSIVNSIWDYKLSELRLKTRFSCCRLPLLYSPIYKCSVGNPGALWCKSCNECFHLMRISEKSLNTVPWRAIASDWWILKSVPRPSVIMSPASGVSACVAVLCSLMYMRC